MATTWLLHGFDTTKNKSDVTKKWLSFTKIYVSDLTRTKTKCCDRAKK